MNLYEMNIFFTYSIFNIENMTAAAVFDWDLIQMDNYANATSLRHRGDSASGVSI